MKTRRARPVSVAVLLLLLIISIFPFYVMFLGAFKSNAALTLIPPDLNPFENLIFKNLTYVVGKSSIFLWLENSFIISIGVALLTIFVSATAGYAFAKIRFPGNSFLFAVVIATMILPKQIMLIPNFLVAKNLNLPDTLIGVILTSVAPSFAIFLCRQFMTNIPMELMESAEIDGCSETGKFLRVIVPLSLPAMGAVGIFAFFGAYNDYLWQLIMISDKKLQTVPIGVAMFAQKSVSNLGYQLTAAALATVPLLIIFLYFQKFFIRGITMGGIKG